VSKALVIVESPAKAKTINKYLGKQYLVMASLGHVKDLPKKDLAVDVENVFEPRYEVIEGKRKLMQELKAAAKKVDSVYLAADPDREGEAICFHLQEELDGRKKDSPKFYRVMFNEITSKAIHKAFEKPMMVNVNLVEAQQARRVLDRLVGYKISPLLWDKVRRGLSAGRVQTVALRLIVERERLIRAFEKKEYWTLDVDLAAKKPPILTARLAKIDGETPEVGKQETADSIVAQLDGVPYIVKSVATREKKRNPVAPFTTSKLQQAAYNRLRYTAKRTMMLAQRLYEGVELGEEGSVGLITYMRTDSVHVSNDALIQVRELIPERFGSNYLPEKPNYYKSKKDAQEAHEAVRPTDAMRAPEDVRKYLDEDLFKLYQLIWQRFVASQMLPAIFDQTTIDISAGDYTFRATGSVQKFDGYLRVYQMPASIADREEDEKEDEGEGRALPQVAEGQTLRLDKIRPDQHFTEPPPRFNDATLVKELEEDGIGRPRLTLRSFQPSSSANTSPRTRDDFRPPCSASASACCW